MFVEDSLLLGFLIVGCRTVSSVSAGSRHPNDRNDLL